MVSCIREHSMGVVAVLMSAITTPPYIWSLTRGVTPTPTFNSVLSGEHSVKMMHLYYIYIYSKDFWGHIVYVTVWYSFHVLYFIMQLYNGGSFCLLEV